MLSLLSAILAASLLGSAHCAGMCGAFVAFAVGAPLPTGKPAPSRFALNGAYNLGRLVTYMMLGAIAGGVGAAVDLGGSMIGVQRIAAGVAGAIVAGFGAVALLRHAGVHIPRAPLPPALIRLATAGHNYAFTLSPMARAALVGLLTTLLPCGWLYAFVITSAGTASPLWGAVCMAAFWLGTLPVMAAIGLGVQSLAGPMRKHLPLVTSLLLVVTGLLTLFGRVTMPDMPASATRTPRSVDQAIESVGHADELCPLCGDK